jgi:hypothetical protein
MISVASGVVVFVATSLPRCSASEQRRPARASLLLASASSESDVLVPVRTDGAESDIGPKYGRVCCCVSDDYAMLMHTSMFECSSRSRQ